MPAFTFPSAGNVSSRISGLAVRTAAANSGLSGLDSPAGAATTSPQETQLLTSITGDIGNLRGLAASNAANAAASTTQSEGYLREAEAYENVGAIAKENATIEGVSGNIKQLQLGRAVQRTLGSQRAAVASAGFASSGSSLDVMKSSIQEGYLADQLIRSQTAVTQGGYLEQGAAAQAEAGGSRLASEAALSLSRSYAAAGSLATANASNETAALTAYLQGRPSTPETALVTSTLGGDPNSPTTFTPPGSSATYNMSDYQVQAQQQINGQTPTSQIGRGGRGGPPILGNFGYNPAIGG